MADENGYTPRPGDEVVVPFTVGDRTVLYLMARDVRALKSTMNEWRHEAEGRIAAMERDYQGKQAVKAASFRRWQDLVVILGVLCNVLMAAAALVVLLWKR